RDEAEAPAGPARLRPDEVPRSDPRHAVAEDVEGRAATRVDPPGAAQKGERAEDRGARDEVHGEQAELPVGGHVACYALGHAPARQQTDHEREQEVAEDDDGDDVPALHGLNPPGAATRRRAGPRAPGRSR